MPGPVAGAENPVMDEPFLLGRSESRRASTSALQGCSLNVFAARRAWVQFPAWIWAPTLGSWLTLDKPLGLPASLSLVGGDTITPCPGAAARAQGQDVAKPPAGCLCHQRASCLISCVTPGRLLNCPRLPSLLCWGRGEQGPSLPPAVLISHLMRGAGIGPGVHGYPASVRPGQLHCGERLFLVRNWPQGRGDPAESPFGGPEAGREEASRWQPPSRAKRDASYTF